MKYGHDQREWVRAADEKLPGLIANACKAQQDAATAHAYIEHVRGTSIKLDQWLEIRRQASAEAIAALNRVLYYQGMRNANLPRN